MNISHDKSDAKAAPGAAPGALGKSSALQSLRKQYAPPKKEVENAPLLGDDLVDEWDEVERRTAELQTHVESQAGKGVVKDQNTVFSKISYPEVEQWLSQVVIDPLVLEAARSQCSPGTGNGTDLVLYLKTTHFDFNDAVHFRMLRTIYTSLTRNAVCGRTGMHWEVIGFQGQDPCSDLNRSGGVLNVLHMFYCHSFYPDLFKAIHLLSQDAYQHFPLACTSINITQLVLDSFLEGRLNTIWNQASTSAFEVLCRVYCACVYNFYDRWKRQKHTIQDFDSTKKWLQKEQAEVLLQNFHSGIQEMKDRSDPSKYEFTDLQFGSGQKQTIDEVQVESPNDAPCETAAIVSGRLSQYQVGSTSGGAKGRWSFSRIWKAFKRNVAKMFGKQSTGSG